MYVSYDCSPAGRNTKFARLTICGDDKNIVSMWFSYDTVVALQTRNGRFIRKNIWGPTTGRQMKEAGLTTDGGFVEVDEQGMDIQLSKIYMVTLDEK